MVQAGTPLTAITGFTTELNTWQEVKAVADFTWPSCVESQRQIRSSNIVLNGSFFVTPSLISLDDIVSYGSIIRKVSYLITGDGDGDSLEPDNGTAVVVEDVSTLRADSELKALRFITGVSGRVKLECTRMKPQTSEAGEIVSDG